ncbi:MAG: HlyU family transcriptional regulator [Hyphomicrobiales bacterium]
MSFLKKLFGGGESVPKPGKPSVSIDYNGYKITPAPMKDGSQFRLAGTIAKEIDGVEKSHMLIRADTYPSKESAEEATLAKARRVIDEQGDMIFA